MAAIAEIDISRKVAVDVTAGALLSHQASYSIFFPALTLECSDLGILVTLDCGGLGHLEPVHAPSFQVLGEVGPVRPFCQALWRNNRDVDNAKQFIELLRELRQENDPPVRVRLVFNREDA